MTVVDVVIPVGPSPNACRYLDNALESVDQQTTAVDRIILVDDMHDLSADYTAVGDHGLPITIWRSPWRLGVPGAFNAGVGLAASDKADLIIMLGADDWLEPQAVERLVNNYNENKQRDAYYSFSLKYSDTGEIQVLPCNAAAVTPGLWRFTGGFPPESAVGACDSMLLSILLAHHPELIVHVDPANPLYNYRRHPDTDTGMRQVEWQGPIFSVRHLLTLYWKQPQWGRYK